MVDKKFTLLTREVISLSKELLPSTSYHKYKAPAFKREKDKYYIYFNNEKEVISLSIKKHAFFKLFDTNSKAISKYIKKEKLNIKKEEDLIKIFKFYASL